MFEILIIRHGEPDYENDSLTEKGKKDVQLIAERLKDRRIDKIYASPMGRAQMTAAATAEMKGMKIETLDFLHEFIGKIVYPNGEFEYPWHIDGDIYAKNYEEFMRPDFYKDSVLVDDEFRYRIELVKNGLRDLLGSYGLRKTVGGYVHDEGDNPHKTIALFCHGGVGVLLTALLCDLPIMKAWPHLFLNTSSITEIDFALVGKTLFPLCTTLGDTAHLEMRDTKFIAAN